MSVGFLVAAGLGEMLGQREMGEGRELFLAGVGRNHELAGDGVGGDLEALDRDRFVVLVDLDLALPGRDDRLVPLAEVLAGRRLDVDDPEIRAARRDAIES